MNLREAQAVELVCPMMSAGKPKAFCEASNCMLWEWNEPMFDGPDSFVSDPPPKGHCGLASVDPLNLKNGGMK